MKSQIDIITTYDEFDECDRKVNAMVNVLQIQKEEWADVEKNYLLYDMIQDLLTKQRKCFDVYYNELKKTKNNENS